MFLPSQLWRAYKLGLYSTIQQQKYCLPIKQVKNIKRLVKLKRFEAENAQYEVVQLLTDTYGSKWFRWVVSELSPIYPDIIFEFLKNHFKDLPKKAWLMNIYVALSIKYEDINIELIQYLDGKERLLFLSNLSKHHQEKYDIFNQYLKEFELNDLVNKSSFSLSCFEFKSTKKINNPNQVTILVTTHNSSNTIEFCLKSLLNQSWQNIQIIVIDDGSDDDTVQIVKSIQDERLMVIALPKNVGTFAAKSIGAMYATGEFMTCQDSDDLAHPDKIKEQVQPLIDDDNLVATHSYWLRIDEKGNYYARQHYPLLRHNPASPLFRRKKVQSEIGLWHLSKTGADSEFFERLKLVYKDKILPIKKPLTFASHRSDSLMNSGEYGVHNKESALNRLDYWESWRLWHLACKKPVMPPIEEQINSPSLFDVPQKLVVSKDNIRYNLDYLKKSAP